jgi:hypothetical protein
MMISPVRIHLKGYTLVEAMKGNKVTIAEKAI